MGLRAFVFDVDGTLADTERDGHRVAFNRAFRESGLDWEWDEHLYGRLLATTGGRERILRFWQEVDPEAARSHDAWQRCGEIHATKTRHYVRMVEAGAIGLRPGVERALRESREAGLRLAIATTTSEANVTALMAATLGSDCALFDCIAAGDAVPRKKPDPAIYRLALERIGCEPRECVAFEDSQPGFQAAAAAGIATVVTTNSYTAQQRFDGALAVLDGWGTPERPASGSVQGAPWSGLVGPAAVAAWVRAR